MTNIIEPKFGYIINKVIKNLKDNTLSYEHEIVIAANFQEAISKVKDHYPVKCAHPTVMETSVSWYWGEAGMNGFSREGTGIMINNPFTIIK